MEFPELWERVGPYVRSKNVVFSKERMAALIRQKEIGLVWLTEDLAKHAQKKIIHDCLKKDIPCICMATSGDIAEKTGMENVKVISLRKSFSGLAQLLRKLDDEIFTTE